MSLNRNLGQAPSWTHDLATSCGRCVRRASPEYSIRRGRDGLLGQSTVDRRPSTRPPESAIGHIRSSERGFAPKLGRVSSPPHDSESNGRNRRPPYWRVAWNESSGLKVHPSPLA